MGTIMPQRAVVHRHETVMIDEVVVLRIRHQRETGFPA
jgi:hypothetical protein